MNKEQIAAAVLVGIVGLLLLSDLWSAPAAAPREATDDPEVESWFAQSRSVREPMFLGPLPNSLGRNVFAEFEEWGIPALPQLNLPPSSPRPRPVPQPVFPGGLAYPWPLRVVEGSSR